VRQFLAGFQPHRATHRAVHVWRERLDAVGVRARRGQFPVRRGRLKRPSSTWHDVQYQLQR
jgi:hypothetical protein